MIWFAVSKKSLLLLCDGGLRERSEQEWKEKLKTGALTWVRGDGLKWWIKDLLVDSWVPSNLYSQWTQWFLTSASRFWPQPPSLNLSQAERFAPAFPPTTIQYAVEEMNHSVPWTLWHIPCSRSWLKLFSQPEYPAPYSTLFPCSPLLCLMTTDWIQSSPQFMFVILLYHYSSVTCISPSSVLLSPQLWIL